MRAKIGRKATVALLGLALASFGFGTAPAAPEATRLDLADPPAPAAPRLAQATESEEITRLFGELGGSEATAALINCCSRSCLIGSCSAVCADSCHCAECTCYLFLFAACKCKCGI